jgi:predicted DNA-binding protein YlxM (UPF0122 family)
MYLLDELWKGKITPDERAVRESSTYKKINHESIEYLNAFYEELSTEGKKAFDLYFQKEMDLAEISERDTFIRGVRIGARFILDVLGEYNSQLPPRQNVFGVG